MVIAAKAIPLERRINVGQRISIGKEITGGLVTVLTPESPDFRFIMELSSREALTPAELEKAYGTYFIFQKLCTSGGQVPFNFGYGYFSRALSSENIPHGEGASGAGILIYDSRPQQKDPMGILFAMHNHYAMSSSHSLKVSAEKGHLWKVSEEEYKQITDLLVPMPRHGN